MSNQFVIDVSIEDALGIVVEAESKEEAVTYTELAFGEWCKGMELSDVSDPNYLRVRSYLFDKFDAMKEELFVEFTIRED